MLLALKPVAGLHCWHACEVGLTSTSQASRRWVLMPVAGKFSFVRTISQALPGAMSQVGLRHMRTRLKRRIFNRPQVQSLWLGPNMCKDYRNIHGMIHWKKACTLILDWHPTKQEVEYNKFPVCYLPTSLSSLKNISNMVKKRPGLSWGNLKYTISNSNFGFILS